MREWGRGVGRAAKWVVAAPLMLLAIPIMLLAIPIILVLNLLGLNKSSAGPDYVAGYLELFLAGNEGDRDWDNFCSVPLNEERLDSIRERACVFEPPGELGEAGQAELRELLAEVRMMISAEPAA
jgi:hypothetical protein